MIPDVFEASDASGLRATCPRRGFEFALERKFNDMHRTGCTTTCTVFAPIVKWSGLFCYMRDNGPHARTSPSLHRNAGRSPGTTPPDGLWSRDLGKSEKRRLAGRSATGISAGTMPMIADSYCEDRLPYPKPCS